ncbi:hypothetical protein F4779DRAFT_628195 [Xylariaceae sp. FL0662B]|nr:hypothetical protein F4779DRAFT_628195 [Xylariaceae sp. FL0662B]
MTSPTKITVQQLTSAESSSSLPPDTSKQCSICGATFSRHEHLARHAKTHTQEKPFKCTSCGKYFARQDVLARHIAAHRDSTDPATAIYARACRQCAASRVRCSKTNPCTRCSERDIGCVYPNTAKLIGLSSSTARLRIARALDASTAYAQNDGDAIRSIPLLPTHEIDDIEPVATTSQQSTDVALLVPSHHAVDPGLVGPSSWESVPPAFEGPELLEQQRYDSIDIRDTGFQNGTNEQVTDLLSMNWMSPEYSNSVDWGGLLPGASLVNVGPDMAASSFPVHQQPPATPDLSGAWLSMNGRYQDLDKEPEEASVMPPHTSTDPAAYHSPAGDRSADGSRATDSAEASCYVDGDEARAPFRGQSTQQRLRRAVQSADSAQTLSGHSVSRTNSNLSPPAIDTFVNEASYNNMVQNVCVELSESLVVFNPAEFPSQRGVTDLVQLYFDNFHPVFPLLRKSDFANKTSTHWILLLAVAAIGEKFIRSSRGPSDDGLAQLLETICSRLVPNIYYDNNTSSWTQLHDGEKGQFNLPILQAIILNLICIIHSGKKSLMERALVEKHYLVAGCSEMHLLSSPHDEDMVPHDVEDLSQSGIRDWLTLQSRNRTGLMIWLLDFMIAYEFGSAPLLQLVDARCLLPCHDHVWESPSADRISAAQTSAVTLLDAVEMLYIEKRMPEHLTEFSINLLIHAVLRRSKEVIQQSQTRLASWTPTAEIQSRIPRQKGFGETWPPSTPLLSKWRNSACDCLDILHWHANSKAARAAGCEQPTIMYLHLSRLVLLTPMAQIQTLASIVNASPATPSVKYIEARSQVLRWAIHDAFKARLSIIHAGAVFWHIRRYSSGGFLEPFAIYAGTLAIWAYSVSLQFARQQGELLRLRSAASLPQPSAAHQQDAVDGHTSSPESVTSRVDLGSTPRTETEEAPDPSFIHLDRPCDDEMVQTYLRHGDKMSAYVSRVGNIADETAPRKIVLEGLRLLAGEPTCGRSPVDNDDNERRPVEARRWGIEVSFLHVLQSLAQTIEQGGLNPS